MVVATLGYTDENGELILLPFRGSDTRTVEMDASYARIQNRLRKIDTYLTHKHTVCTFVTCEEMRDHCLALAKSEDPMAFVKGEWVPITILSIEFQDVIPWTRPQPYKITYIHTDEDAKAFDPDSNQR